MTWSELAVLGGALVAIIGVVITILNRSVDNSGKVANTAKLNKEAEKIEQEIESKYATQVREWLKDLEEVKDKHDIVLAERDAKISQLHTDYLTALKDITEQKLKLDRFNKATRRILVNMDVPYWECDGTGALIYVNGAWLKLFGLTQAQALGTDWTQAIPEAEREALLMEWSSRVVDQSEREIHFTLLNPVTDKSVKVKSLYAIIFDSESEIYKIIGVTVEIREDTLV